MSFFKRYAETHHDTFDIAFRELVILLIEMEIKMALDLSKLQSDVAAQGDLIAKLQVQVGAGSSVDQTVVDQIAANVEANNTALNGLLTPAST